jgi:DENN domain-containing protein 5
MSSTKDHSSANVAYRLAKLLKKIENRSCADCGAPLLEWQNYCGSLTNKVWLCMNCYEAHVDVFGDRGNNYKKIKDSWTEKEVALMESAESNEKVNSVYEKYVDNDWSKTTQDSSYTERVQWIKAKYKSRYFCIPPIKAAVVRGKKHGKQDPGASNTLPMRTVDYFVTLGVGKVKGKPLSIEEAVFNVDVISCFPTENFYVDQPSPLPDLLGPMVFPNGLRLSKKEERPYTFTFVLTDTYRVKQFCAVLIVHELLDPAAVQQMMVQQHARQSMSVQHTNGASNVGKLGENDVFYAPKALVVLSHYPFFHLFTRFLDQIYRVSLSSAPLPIERYIANFV